MPKAARKMLQSGYSYDEPDRMPSNITITNFDLFLYVVAIVGHLVDLGLDINVAVRYSLERKMMEFGWTLAFILLPAFVNTAVSIRMYAQDKQQDSVTNEFTKRKWLRVFILVLQMAPILRFTDALIYAVKSRRAARAHDAASQRMYYALMLKEDSDAALLRVFECFLEAAPQQVLQTSLLLRQYDRLAVHQILSICSSIVGMGWCLAAYQRAVRFAQQDKLNMSWPGTVLQTLWHFLVTCEYCLWICSSIVGMGWCLAAYQRAVRFAQQDKLNMSWPGTVLQTLWHFLVTCEYCLWICSSIVGMGWCLAAYQRAVRFAQQDKLNMSWPGTVLQTLWHFLVTCEYCLWICSSIVGMGWCLAAYLGKTISHSA
ncbi:cell death abnormality protein 8-like [Maniola hyperantus]|uniref:cell death abnormality protein 8-like n=1 Tax=Aphantopus hyperantus TaxID=2795564 RepID=UPI003748B05A